MELQERDRVLTPEEQDNLKRSTKKIKIQGESTTVDPAQGVDHEESSPKPMEESPEGKEKKEEVIPHLDSENGESKTKSVKRALWVPDLAVNQSYKDKLVGINGRDKDLFVNEDADEIEDLRRTRPLAKNQQPAPAPKHPNSGSRFEVFNLEESGEMEIDKEVENKDQETSDEATGVLETPIKSNESNPKAPTKHPTAIPKGRADKDAQMEEQLRTMKMFEKQNREAVSSLVDLGATKEQENPLHALRDCPTVLPLWRSIIKPEVWTRFSTSNVKDWISLNLTSHLSIEKGLNWNCFFSFAIWSIWKQRNESVFNEVRNSAITLIPSIKAQYYEFMNVLSLKSIGSLNQNSLWRAPPIWSPPDTGWCKINVDGSFNEDSNNITCGGVIRDHEGKWIRGFSKKLGKGCILLAEICGILEGLLLAWSNNLKQIIVESDSVQAVNLISVNLDRNHPLYNITHKIKLLLAKAWTAKVVHISKDSNKVADSLACKAHTLGFVLYTFNDPPVCCIDLYREDSRKACLSAYPDC
ncbi:hypothetical protein G2W53_022452 [Senna tora]|uniref:RNase H type-1 domain-containing protein n=1 Tax=Senna tora TaxID=362788 RepID=A0A834TL86_9FABA|nr:hypothetical protein G2W53_022452 [Senna tora]